jgi:hypothetical protein
LRRTADQAESKFGSDVKAFVHRNFYVDDALSSHPTADEAIDLRNRSCQSKGIEQTIDRRQHTSTSERFVFYSDSERELI